MCELNLIGRLWMEDAEGHADNDGPDLAAAAGTRNLAER